MRYVVSDIHGHLDKLWELERKINLKDHDTLYILGDVVDRGPEPINLLKYCMSRENIVLLMGNHEDMMLNFLLETEGMDRKNLSNSDLYSTDYFGNWEYNGGDITYTQFLRESKETQKEIIDYLKSLPIELTVKTKHDTYYLVHGMYVDEDIYESMTEESKRKQKIWGRIRRYSVGPEGKTVIVGHTPTITITGKSEIFVRPNLMCIDCGMATYGLDVPNSYQNGSDYYLGNCKIRLGCLCLNNGKEYYV